MQYSVSAVSKVCVARADSTGSSNSHIFAVSRVPFTAVGFLLFLPVLVRNLRTCHAKKEVFVSRPLLGPVLQLQSSTFSLIVSTEPKGTQGRSMKFLKLRMGSYSETLRTATVTSSEGLRTEDT